MASVEPFKRSDGTVYYRARILLADGTRERVDVPEKYAYSAERRALYAEAIQEREDERGELLAKKRERIAAKEAAKLPAVGPETLARYRERLNLHRDELGRGKGDPSAWNAWIVPHLGKLPMATVTREHIETFRDLLDSQIATHKRTGGKEGLSPKRASNVWSEVTITFKSAVSAKKRDLRVRTDNPCTGVEPPERGDSRRKTDIYPSEMTALLASAAPLEWREAYAIGSYLFLRPGELRALTWADVDLVATVVHVTKAYDERTKSIKAPKTENGIRDVPIAPTLVPLLKRMGDGKAPSDLVCPVLREWSEDVRAQRIREHLRAAGCERPRLWSNTSTTMAVNFRSLRDSGITWLAIAGVDVVKMQRRAGHDHVQTTMGYVKRAEDVGGTIGVPFGPLPSSLLAQKSGQVADGIAKTPANLVPGAGVETDQIAESPAKQGRTRDESHPADDVSVRVHVDASTSEPERPGKVESPRDRLLAALGRAIGDATAVGDLEAARVAHAALGSLLASAATEPAGVVDLAAARARRGTT